MNARNYKKFIPCMYLYKGMLVKNFNDKTIIHHDPAEAAGFYSTSNADGLLVFDLSTEDAEHEEALLAMKKICEAAQIPVIGAGNVRKMEDVKKLLYAGCKKAALNYAKQDNIDLTVEVSKRFGKEKIAACFANPAILIEHAGLLEAHVSELICVNPYIPKGCPNPSKVPMLIMMADVSLDKLIEHLNMPGVDGITGEIINANAKELSALKTLCLDNGVPVSAQEAAYQWDDLKKNSDGLVPVIVEDFQTKETLMLAYMNEEAYLATLQTGKMTYYSRSRQTLWLKGETSGHFQYVRSLLSDCDMDTLLARVAQEGNACHTGAYSCFFHEIIKPGEEGRNPIYILKDVLAIIKDRKAHPKEGSYTNYLFDKGLDKILKKLGEEAAEIIIAAKNPDTEQLKYEISDFLYHMMVLMEEKGIGWEEITSDLAKR